MGNLMRTSPVLLQRLSVRIAPSFSFQMCFGIWQNSKLMADKFTSKRYTCVILDIFNGDEDTTNRHCRRRRLVT